MYKVVKTYGHERGFSCVFRQPKALHSRCSLLHGYALAFEITFSATTLDNNNWVIDFGSLDWLKSFLEKTFDHKTLIAVDDAYLDEICALQGIGVIDVLVLEKVGCEAFAEFVFDYIKAQLPKQADFYAWNGGSHYQRLFLESVKVSEHGANSAIFTGYN